MAEKLKVMYKSLGLYSVLINVRTNGNNCKGSFKNIERIQKFEILIEVNLTKKALKLARLKLSSNYCDNIYILSLLMGSRWPSGLGRWSKLNCSDHYSPSSSLRLCTNEKSVWSTHITRDQVCQLRAQDKQFLQGTLASFSSKSDRWDMTEILLKVRFMVVKKGKKIIASISMPITE